MSNAYCPCCGKHTYATAELPDEHESVLDSQGRWWCKKCVAKTLGKIQVMSIIDDRIVHQGGGPLYTCLDEFPPCCGVFIFRKLEEIRYIGWAAAGRLREQAEAAVDYGRDYGSREANYFVTSSGDAAKSLCAEWVEKYNPCVNSGAIDV